MPNRDTADLVVVGAGTIGGWASVFAKEHGAERVVVLERATPGRARPRARPASSGRRAGRRRRCALGDVVDRLLPVAAGALRDRQRLPRARLPDPRDGRGAGAARRRNAWRCSARPGSRRRGTSTPRRPRALNPTLDPDDVPRRDVRAGRRMRRSAAERPRVLARDAAGRRRPPRADGVPRHPHADADGSA